MGPKSKACVACRVAKRTCIHNEHPPCKRCKDRGDECLFPPPGTSSLHRQARGLRPGRQRIDVAHSESTSPQDGNAVLKRSGSEASPRDIPCDLSSTNPFDLFTDEVKNSYLRCSYKWCFHHIPTLLDRVRKGTLEISLIWAILALAIRFSNDAPRPFSTPLEASNAFAAHARSMILQDIEQPTLSRIQTILMVTGHSWGAGEGRRAWMYLGMAVRMAQVIGLFQEASTPQSPEEFILAEERRRTAWTCFLMDSLLSGGKGRKRSLGADDMQIALPCDTGYFYFGEPVRCQRLNEGPSPSFGNLGIVGYTMQVADTWGAVARWACSTTDDLPWEPNSEFQTLMRSLSRWRNSLPSRLAFSIASLHAHSASDQGQAYCYMHSVYFMSLMFLHRSYLSSLPEVEPRKRAAPGSPLERRWHEWELQSKHDLLEVANQVCQMLAEMRSFGLFFLRGLVPWTGFTAYTATGIMLYYYHFPDQNENPDAMKQARDHVVQGCMFLKDMNKSWPMADTWRETIKQMQLFYSNIKTKGEQSVTNNERREVRNAMVDYGALQPSPVHSSDNDAPVAGILANLRQQSYGSNKNIHSAPTPASLPSLQNSPLPLRKSPSPPVELPPLRPPLLQHQQHIQQHQQQQQQQQFLQLDFLSPGFDMFEMDFNINDADLEAGIADAAQGFWTDFPGEVEVEVL